MSPMFYIASFLGLTLFSSQVSSYTYIQDVNTESGFCEGPEYGKLAIGEIGYKEESCERVICHSGYIAGAGCGIFVSDDPTCPTVPGEGKYPDCCPEAMCP